MSEFIECLDRGDKPPPQNAPKRKRVCGASVSARVEAPSASSPPVSKVIAVLPRTPETTGREQGGRFLLGVSGNPRGRPLGRRNNATMAAEALLQGEAEALTRRVIELALAGDPTCLKLCIERLLPRRRSGRVQLRLPVIDRIQDLPRALGRLLAAATAGAIDLEDAATLAALIDRQRQALETRDLVTRIEDLEALNATGGRL